MPDPHLTLTHRVEHEICTLVAAGVPLNTAARAVGIPPDRVRKWVELGRRPNAPAHWARFVESVEAARVEHAHEALLRLAKLRGRRASI